VLERMAVQYKLEGLDPPAPDTVPRNDHGIRRGACPPQETDRRRRQFGEVYLRVEPLARGAGFEFVDQVKAG